MNKEFDNLGEGAQQRQWHAAWAKEALRVLKPGGHIIAFGGTRTYHHLASALEEVGFGIRDCISWVHSQGFPKSLDVSKAIDKAAGAEREVIGRRTDRAATPKQDIRGGRLMNGVNGGIDCSAITAPATDAARQWNGWGTALKPAVEPAVLARKPLVGTVVANVLKWGTGAINVDGCRVESETINTWDDGAKPFGEGAGHKDTGRTVRGRWPANLMHDGSDDVVGLFPDIQVGSASRFFYCAKANKQERGAENKHPTVKPVALMEYLIKLVLPPRGIVLDPFAGSGTTLLAAKNLGVRAIGMELEPEYAEIAKKRIRELS
jgi:site-specific DNA-methyltransferase (adenine-specific)